MARLKGAKTDEALLKRNKPCSHEGCQNKVRAKGMCITHYADWRKKTDPEFAAKVKARLNKSNAEAKAKRDLKRPSWAKKQTKQTLNHVIPDDHIELVFTIDELQERSGYFDLTPFLKNLVEDQLIHSFIYNQNIRKVIIIVHKELEKNLMVLNDLKIKPKGILE